MEGGTGEDKNRLLEDLLMSDGEMSDNEDSDEMDEGDNPFAGMYLFTYVTNEIKNIVWYVKIDKIIIMLIVMLMHCILCMQSGCQIC